MGNVIYSGYPGDRIKVLGDKIKKVHFKDYKKVTGGLHGFVDLLASDVNWNNVMSQFKNINYNNWVTAEMLPPYIHFSETIIYKTSNAI